MSDAERLSLLKIVGGVVVYGFAMFGLGVYLTRFHGDE